MFARKTQLLVALSLLVFGVAAYAGAVGGPKVLRTRVLAHSSDSYTVVFCSGERAVVEVVGDGDTDLDLFLYDENGNLIDSDTDGSDHCVVSCVPRWTGPFRIVVRNLGSVYNEYVIRTN